MEVERPPTGIIGATVEELRAAGPAPGILSPSTAGLDPHLATMACALPLGDANAALLDETRAGVGADSAFAAVLAHDPFRKLGKFLEELSGHGVRRIINWPSVSVLDGEHAAALEHSGFTWAGELALLREAAAAGFATAVVIHEEAQIGPALEIRPDMLLLTPGLARRDPGRQRERAAEFVTLVTEARQTTEVALRVHLHPAFAGLLQAQLPADVGFIQHRSGAAEPVQ